MFNLDHAISDWRVRMTAGGVKDASILDELEAHLRDEIQERSLLGDSEVKAFEFAVARIGNPKSLRTEFNKISGATSLPVLIGVALWVGIIVWMSAFSAGKVHDGKWSALLFTHIISLTAGYLAAFLTGAFAIYFICAQSFGKSSPAAQNSLARAAFVFSGIAAALTIAGLVLGIIWSAQNRGTYWSGTPREIGPLIASIWFLAAWLIQRFGWKDIHTRMLACVGGNIVGALCWFGALFLEHDRGLSGFASFWPLQIFIVVHLLVVALAFRRRFEIAKS